MKIPLPRDEATGLTIQAPANNIMYYLVSIFILIFIIYYLYYLPREEATGLTIQAPANHLLLPPQLLPRQKIFYSS